MDKIIQYLHQPEWSISALAAGVLMNIFSTLFMRYCGKFLHRFKFLLGNWGNKIEIARNIRINLLAKDWKEIEFAMQVVIANRQKMMTYYIYSLFLALMLGVVTIIEVVTHMGEIHHFDHIVAFLGFFFYAAGTKEFVATSRLYNEVIDAKTIYNERNVNKGQ